MAQRFKTPVNYRGAPVHTSTPEPFDISGGVALLAEAPADPSTYPVTVTVNGQARTRVTTAPNAGQFRVMTQTVIGSDGQGHNEYLPLLQFSVGDEGLPGSCDYWANGTVLTSQFFDVLLAFLTPLTGYTSLEALPQATMTTTLRGRPGDIAFLSSGEMAYSDGSSWRLFSGSTPSLSGGLPLGTAIALALDSGYVGPSLSDSQSFDNVIAFSPNAIWQSLNSWAGDLDLAQTLALTTDAVAAHVGATDYAAAYGLSLDGVSAQVGALSLGGTFGHGPDASYAAGGGGATVLTFETDTEGMTLTGFARSSVSPIAGSYSLYYTATTASVQTVKATKPVTITNGSTVSFKAKAIIGAAGDNDGSVAFSLWVDGAMRGDQVTSVVGDGAVKTISAVVSLTTGTHTLEVRSIFTPNNADGELFTTPVQIWIDEVTFQ